MKKLNCLILIIIFFSCLVGINNNSLQLHNLHKYYKNSKYNVYSYDNFHTENRIKCGNYYIYEMHTEKIKFNKKFCEELIIYGDKNDIINILKNLDITIKKQDTNYIYNIYGYSPKINNYLVIDNTKVNIQIYSNDSNIIKIASPIIFGYM